MDTCIRKFHINFYSSFFSLAYVYIYIVGDVERSDFPDARTRVASTWASGPQCWVHVGMCSHGNQSAQPDDPRDHSALPLGATDWSLEATHHLSWCCFLAVKDHVDIGPDEFGSVVNEYFHVDWNFPL